MTLRRATPKDAEPLATFAQSAFDAAFGHLYAPADLAAFNAESRSSAKYRAQLADPNTSVALAESDGRLAGYCLIVRGEQFDEHPAPRPERPVLLSQLYCAGGMTSKGIGAALLGWAIDGARDWRADALTLSVFSENYGAQRFYRRHGFAHVADIHFWVGNHRDDEFLYQLRL